MVSPLRSQRFALPFIAAVCLFFFVAGVAAAAERQLTGETFTNATTVPGQWIFGGYTCLTAGSKATTVPGSVPPCANTPIDPVGSGVLRFTPASTYLNGYIVYNSTLASNAGLVAIFDYFSWGGTGADGLSFFFLDGTQPAPAVPGAVGAGLGYAQNCSTPGIATGYVGVGLDEYGNYSQPSGFECHNGGTRFLPDTIAIRGSQAANYPYLSGYGYPPGAALPFSLDVPYVTTRPPGQRVRVTLTTSLFLSVEIDRFDGKGFVTYIQPFSIAKLNGQAFPPLFRFGYAASTGAVTNYHEIRNVFVDTAPPLLVMTKTHTGNFEIGGAGQFTLSVSNVGGSTTTGATTVVDTLPPGLTYNSASGNGWNCNAAGQQVTCANSAAVVPSTSTSMSSFPPLLLKVNVGSAAAPSAQNVAVASGGGATNSYTATDTVTISTPALTLTKSHVGSFPAGGQGTYTLQVANSSSVPTTATTTVVDSLPAGLTYASGGGNGWTCNASGQTVTCSYPAPIPAGAQANPLPLTVNVSQNAPGSVTNSATASSGAANTPPATDPTTIVRPALGLTKSHSGSFSIGQPGVYTLTPSNPGAAATFGTLTLVDTLPAQLAYASATGTGWTCGASAQIVTCTSTTPIPAGSNGNPVTLTVGVNGPPTSNAINTATLNGGGAGAGASASDPTAITGSVALTLVKSHAGNFSVGQTGTYTLDAGNSGTVATTAAVNVVDTLPPGLTFSSASGTSWSCTAAGQVVTCTYAPGIAAGGTAAPLTLNVNVLPAAVPSVLNTATASGGGAAGPVTATDETTVGGGLPNLIVSKSHEGTFEAGEPGAYTIVVGNDGVQPTTAAPVVLTDDLPRGLTYESAKGTGWTCPSAAIAGPATITCTYAGGAIVQPGASFPALLITTTPKAAGSVENTVSATGGGAGNTATATDPTTIDAPAAPPTLTLQKSHTGDFTLGQTGTFTLGVGNVGKVATSGTIALTDTLPPGMTYAGAAGKNWTCPPPRRRHRSPAPTPPPSRRPVPPLRSPSRSRSSRPRPRPWSTPPKPRAAAAPSPPPQATRSPCSARRWPSPRPTPERRPSAGP